MFPIFASKGVLRIYQLNYCEGRFDVCERYKLAIVGKMPDAGLLPDGGDLGPGGRRDVEETSS